MYRLLLVDDEQNVLNALRRELKGEYEVEVFTNPLDALRHCREAPFDLVIADYQMPEMNGVQLLKQLGAILPDAARLVLSGQADIDGLVGAINETHIYRFLAKPWDRFELKACIAQALDYREAVLENRRLADAYRGGRAEPERREICDPCRVMLVDADQGAVELMRRGLTQSGGYEGLYGAMRQEISHGAASIHDLRLEANGFGSAAQALEHAKTHDCDLVIAAQALPDMEGIGFLRKFRELRPDAARILVCGRPDRDMLSRAINEAQVHGFLNISWNTYELKADAMRRSWNTYQLKSTVMQALAARDLLLENRRLAGLAREQG